MPGARACGWIGAAWLCCASCERAEPPPEPPAAATATAAVSASAAASTTAAHQLTGRYSCEFRAARAEVTVPVGVPYATWQEDDGSTATGPGKLVIEVDAEGQVVGTATGALGELRLRGAVDENELRAGVVPADEATDWAMRGTWIGTVRRGPGAPRESTEHRAIDGELRVSSHDGALVRAARCTLAR